MSRDPELTSNDEDEIPKTDHGKLDGGYMSANI
jgi:hypothetical protein